MDRVSTCLPINGAGSGDGSEERLGMSFFFSISSLVVSCTKHARRLSRKLKMTKLTSLKTGPRSPTKVLTDISNKAVLFIQKRRNGYDKTAEGKLDHDNVWQKTILMGDKCQPLDFSGVIYYDDNGNQIPELPMRSPRASPMPAYAKSSTF